MRLYRDVAHPGVVGGPHPEAGLQGIRRLAVHLESQGAGIAFRESANRLGGVLQGDHGADHSIADFGVIAGFRPQLELVAAGAGLGGAVDGAEGDVLAMS